MFPEISFWPLSIANWLLFTTVEFILEHKAFFFIALSCVHFQFLGQEHLTDWLISKCYSKSHVAPWVKKFNFKTVSRTWHRISERWLVVHGKHCSSLLGMKNCLAFGYEFSLFCCSRSRLLPLLTSRKWQWIWHDMLGNLIILYQVTVRCRTCQMNKMKRWIINVRKLDSVV